MYSVYWNTCLTVKLRLQTFVELHTDIKSPTLGATLYKVKAVRHVYAVQK